MPQQMRKTRALCLQPNFRVSRDNDESQALITGYAAVFNQKTDLRWFTESIAPGAFAASISAADDVRALFNHDPSLILGRTPKTLRLKEDDHGLYCEITPPETTLGKDLVISIERGDVSQMSFGFYVETEELDQTGQKPHFTITRAKLFDVSPVTFPAYTGTEVGIERAESELEEEFKSRLQKCGFDMTENFEMERHLKDYRQRKLNLLKLNI